MVIINLNQALQLLHLADQLSLPKVYVRLPGKVNSNSHGARPVHLIITMIKWIRTSRLSIQNSFSPSGFAAPPSRRSAPPASPFIFSPFISSPFIFVSPFILAVLIENCSVQRHVIRRHFDRIVGRHFLRRPPLCREGYRGTSTGTGVPRP